MEEAKLEIRLFGCFEVYRDGVLVKSADWGRRKTQSLFKLLLTRPGCTFTTDQLIEALYPRSKPSRVAANLRTRISQLRRALEPELRQGRDSDYILRVGPGHYRFNTSASYWLDTVEFQKQLRVARELQDKRHWAQALEEYQKATQLYRENYLTDDIYEEWTHEPRQRFRELYLDALESLAECHAQLGQYAQAIEQCQHAISANPYREQAYRRLMRCHYYTGHPDKAARVYGRCIRALREHLDVEPTTKTKQLYHQLKEHQVAWFVDNGNAYDQAATHPQSPVSQRDLGESLTMAHVLQAIGTIAFQEGSYVVARSLFEKSLRKLQEVGEKRGIALLVEQLGWLEASELPEKAACLFGAVEASLQRLRTCLPASMWADHEKSVALVCSRLDELTVAASWAKGRAMTLEEAVQYALGEVIPC